MKWNHLPVAGGLYDQHPDLLEKFLYIFQKRAEQQERERKAEEVKAEKLKKSTPSRVRPSRRFR